MTSVVSKPVSVYPESDGKPIADNTKQFRYIKMIYDGLDTLFQANPDVFVAGDLLWYPVEGEPKRRIAPDILVAFGRPKGDRGSYRQWEEGGVVPQVVFEIISPDTTMSEMTEKFNFYQRYGVEEYYLYDPDRGELAGWLHSNGQLSLIEPMQGWISPRLGIRFELAGTELQLYYPDNHRFATYIELELEQQLEQERQRSEKLSEQLRKLGVTPAE